MKKKGTKVEDRRHPMYQSQFSGTKVGTLRPFVSQNGRQQNKKEIPTSLLDDNQFSVSFPSFCFWNLVYFEKCFGIRTNCSSTYFPMFSFFLCFFSLLLSLFSDLILVFVFDLVLALSSFFFLSYLSFFFSPSCLSSLTRSLL